MIHFFCALSCEAQPLIQHFKLDELKQFDLFRLYQSKDKQFSLVITGIGKLNAASAVSYHHACFNTSIADTWLNIGVAGHANIPVGEARLINKITEQQNNACWYPQILFKSPCSSAALITVDMPSDDYQTALFDMEASGFYQMAIRLGSAELVHCLKIISDNHEQATSTVNADGVKKLISNHINTLENILESLKPFTTEISEINSIPEHYQTFIEKWHFTQSERIQLSRVLRQWSVRFPEKEVMQTVLNVTNGKSAIKLLQRTLAQAEFSIHD